MEKNDKSQNNYEPNDWRIMCEQLDKQLFTPIPNRWTHPKQEDAEFPNNDAQQFYSKDVFRDRNDNDKNLVRKIKKQVRKKKTKEDTTKKRVVSLTQLLNDDELRKEFINNQIERNSNRSRIRGNK